MKTPKHIEELRDSLCEFYAITYDDPRRALQAREVGNLAGKIIASAALQLEYAHQRKEKPTIEFLK